MSKKPRIALCLNGKLGNALGKSHGAEDKWRRTQHGDVAGSDIILQLSFLHWYEYLLKDNDVDVFIHSWDIEFSSQIEETFKPIKSIYENQIKFVNPERIKMWKAGKYAIRQSWHDVTINRVQNYYSRYYGLKKCVELKNEYEKANNFEYDIVMCSRFDLCLKTHIIMEDWYKLLNGSTEDIIIGNGGPAWENKGEKKNKFPKTIQDHYFFSTSSIMNKFSNLYSMMDSLHETTFAKKLAISSHRLCSYWINNILDCKLKFATIEDDKALVDKQECPMTRCLYFNYHMKGKNKNINPRGRLVKIDLSPNTVSWKSFKVKL